ncbi:hypothetical protein ACFFWC_09645 [Plantactinospora siamensis]|uniref:Uncharacterized protein n=1 Tax=Plantactinospora siamensis TaxID=555372 RepID=A0ABV6P4N3_9ACTN
MHGSGAATGLRPPGTAGYTIRLQWRREHQHIHEFHGFFPGADRAWRARDRLARFLRAGPNRPSEALVVAISRAEFDRHHQLTACRRTDCPAIGVARAGGRRAGTLTRWSRG